MSTMSLTIVKMNSDVRFDDIITVVLCNSIKAACLFIAQYNYLIKAK